MLLSFTVWVTDSFFFCLPQATVDAEVQILLSLKKQYKEATGKDWTLPKAGSGVQTKAAQGAQAKSTAMPGVESPEALALKAQVDAQGDKVRQLKTANGAKVRGLLCYGIERKCIEDISIIMWPYCITCQHLFLAQQRTVLLQR
jgi:hypothetical protein